MQRNRLQAQHSRSLPSHFSPQVVLSAGCYNIAGKSPVDTTVALFSITASSICMFSFFCGTSGFVASTEAYQVEKRFTKFPNQLCLWTQSIRKTPTLLTLMSISLTSYLGST